MTDATPIPLPIYLDESNAGKSQWYGYELLHGDPEAVTVVSTGIVIDAVEGDWESAKEKAAQIVTAVNSFQPLVDAAEGLLALMKTKSRSFDDDTPTILSQMFAQTPEQMVMISDFVAARDQLAAALKTAGVE